MSKDPLVSFRGDRAKVPLPLRAAGRYLITGAPLRGSGDNATFLHRATVDYRARPYLILSAPLWQRLARRNAAITAPLLLTIYALIGGTWAPLLVWVAALVGMALWWVGRQAVLIGPRRKDHREWIDPAAKVLCQLIKTPYTRRAGRMMIDLPRGWGRGNDSPDSERPAARINIPAKTPLSATLRRQIQENVGNRLGIPSPVQADWKEAGEHVYVDLMALPMPPKKLTLREMMPAIDAAEDTEVVVGRAAGGRIIKVSLAEDSPHFLMSGASSTGKSVLMQLFLMQRGRRGDGIMILDPKRWSHWRWAGGGKLPRNRVVYAYRDEDLHEAWVAIGEEIRRRIELDEDELDQLRRVFVAVEEANVQTKKLARHWRGLRKQIVTAAKEAQANDLPFDPADLDPPPQSPAIVAMQESVCMGRELKMHVIVAAQRASASIFGGNGGDIRESFQGGRFIARWDRKLWAMLVDTVKYIACPSGPRGIWGLSRGEEFDIFRVPFVSGPEALDMVAGGQPVYGPVLGAQGQRPEVDSTTVMPAIVQAVKLSDAVKELPGLSLWTLRKASTRDPLFPVPVGQEGAAFLYDLSALIFWSEGRKNALKALTRT